MAIASTIVFECRTTATAGNVNGGGFKPGASGTDWSQQDAAQYALTNLTSSGAGAVILTGTSSADMVGNVIHIISGTNFTPGWYEIISESLGVSITVDRNCTTGAGASGVANIGGAMSMNSTLDSAFLSAVAAGNTVYFKNGSFTGGQAITIANGTATLPIKLIGYNASRGDNPGPDSGNQPVLAMGANALTGGTENVWLYMGTTTTAASGITLSTGGGMGWCKCTNTSTTAGRAAVSSAANDNFFFWCNMVSQMGNALSITAARYKIMYCYFHDSDTGATTSATTTSTVAYNIFASNTTSGMVFTGTPGTSSIFGNTFYGRESKIGNGLFLNNATSNFYNLYANIFYGLTTGVNILTTNFGINMGGYNDFFNNTTDNTNYTKDNTDLAVDPTFAGTSQITGTTATTSASVLTQSGGDFSAVTNNIDYLHVVSGTGVTVGIYLITSHTSTTLTVNNALGTSSGGDVVYFVTTGKNFSVGTNLKAAMPVTFGPSTISYLDIGAVQRQEPAASGGGAMIMVQ